MQNKIRHCTVQAKGLTLAPRKAVCNYESVESLHIKLTLKADLLVSMKVGITRIYN